MDKYSNREMTQIIVPISERALTLEKGNKLRGIGLGFGPFINAILSGPHRRLAQVLTFFTKNGLKRIQPKHDLNAEFGNG